MRSPCLLPLRRQQREEEEEEAKSLRQRRGISQIHAVLGGLHLFKAGPEAMEETARAVEEFGVRRLIAGHCTGADRLELLRRRLPGREVLPLAAGQTWLF